MTKYAFQKIKNGLDFLFLVSTITTNHLGDRWNSSIQEQSSIFGILSESIDRSVEKYRLCLSTHTNIWRSCEMED